MKLGSKRTILGIAATAALGLLGIVPASGQTAAPAPKTPAAQTKASTTPAAAARPRGQAPTAAGGEKQQMAEEVFKNVQVLKGISENEFMQTMGFFSASLGESCEFCHVADAVGSWPKYADETPLKVTTRRMVLMMNAINKTNFGGRREVTCYSCHRGDQRPQVTPNLLQVYGTPVIMEPELILKPVKEPTADQIFDKYIQAIGGAQRVAALTSYTAKGTYHPYVGEEVNYPVEVLAKAPNMHATVVHGASGDTATITDGRDAWILAPEEDRPLPVTTLTGGDLDVAKFDAVLAFPANLKQGLTDWRVGPPITIDDHQTQVVQGTTATRAHVKLYFDAQTGLLVREVRFTDSAVGTIPSQVDYSDYRDVAGVKIPFHVLTTWLDGRTTTDITDVQPNVAIDASKFAKPVAPKPANP